MAVMQMTFSDLEGHLSCLKPFNSHASEIVACINDNIFTH